MLRERRLAAETLKSLVQRQPDLRDAHRWLAAIYIDLNTPFAAIEHLRSIKRHYGFLVDPAHRLIGVVSIDSLLRCLGQSRPDLAGALLDHVPALAGASPFREVLGQVARNPHPFPVIDGKGIYMGAVTQTILLEHLCDEETRNA